MVQDRAVRLPADQHTRAKPRTPFAKLSKP